MGLFFLPPLRTRFSCILPCASEAGSVGRPRSGALVLSTYAVHISSGHGNYGRKSLTGSSPDVM